MAIAFDAETAVVHHFRMMHGPPCCSLIVTHTHTNTRMQPSAGPGESWKRLVPLRPGLLTDPVPRHSVRCAAATIMSVARVVGAVDVSFGSVVMSLLRCKDADTVAYAAITVWELSKVRGL